MIFVFGSNEEGIHGAGAALVAAKKYGAVRGVGEGLKGNSYALPTCYCNRKFPTLKGLICSLKLPEVVKYVNNFLKFAREHPELEFQVTQIGCGLAGFKSEEIAPLFRVAPKNCYFDTAWKPWLGDEKHYWGTF